MTGAATMVFPGAMGTQRGEANLHQELRLHSKCLWNGCLQIGGISSAWYAAGKMHRAGFTCQRGREGSGRVLAERSQGPWGSHPV